MPQVALQKINIIASREYMEEILNFLQQKELIQIVDLEEDIKKTLVKILEEERHDFDYFLAETQFAINFLERHKIKEKEGFLKRLIAPAYALTPIEFSKVIKTFYFKDIVEKCKDLEEKINFLFVQKDKLEEEEKLLKNWYSLDIPLIDLKETEKTIILLGEIPKKNFEGFKKEIIHIKLVHFKTVQATEDTIRLIFFINKEKQGLLAKILAKYEFQETLLPKRKVTCKEELVRIKILKEVLNSKIRLEKKETVKLSRFIPKLKVIYDYLLWGRAHQRVHGKTGKTAHIFVLSGWVKKRTLDYLKKELEKITQGKVELLSVKPAKHEAIPVAIENKPILSPLESVTTIYGLPLPHEPDPTPYLAPFFILFFGLCLSDAGYGIVVCALAWIVMTILKVPKENRRLFRVLIYGGISTFFIGVLFGGWFGIDLEILPSFISQPLQNLRQLDPMKNPIPLLILSLALGVLQIWTGIAVKMFWKIKQKKLKEALLGPLPWLYFFAVIIFWVMSKFGILPQTLAQPAYYALLIGMLGLVLTQGYKQKNIFLKLTSGVMSLYGLVGYLSDILSYARLLALGLCTSVIGMVVNLVSVMFRDMIPAVGWLIMILVLIGGHLFNLAISGLGAFIHSARLQYVEFFPKFMEGGGEKFEPFKREFKYVNIKS